MGKIMCWVVALVSALLLSACATAEKEEFVPLPALRDDAAQFLASHPQEPWVLLLQDDGMGNALLVNPQRVEDEADGVRSVWLKLVFPQPLPLSDQQPERVAGTLIYTQVRCAEGTFRSFVFYAVGEDGRILDTFTEANAAFIPMDSNSVAIGIYRLACDTR